MIYNNFIKTEKHSLQNKCLIFFYICLPLVGVLDSRITNLLLFGLMLVLCVSDDFYLLFPACIVYYSYLFVPFTGLSLYRAYSIIVLIKMFARKKITFNKIPQVVQVAVLILYMMLGVMFVNARTALFGIVDIVVVYLLISKYMYKKDKSNFEKIIGLFAIACAFSIITGTLNGNAMSLSYKISGNWRATNRFVGTFVDPNYCSFMYIFAIIGLLVLEPFKKIINRLLIIALLVGIAMTISFSGFIGLAIIYVFYIVLTGKINIKHILMIGLIVCGILGLYWYGTVNTDAPIVGDIVYRVNSYILNYEGSSTGGMAVSRITIYKNILLKFNAQGLFKQLFGMNTDIPAITQSSILVAHNDYVDMMYNCGLIFTFIFYGVMFYRWLASCFKYIKTKDNRVAFIAISKFLWLYFAFTLTMLSERTFYLCLFV